MNDVILECPFCNGYAYLSTNYSHRVKRYYAYVKCDGCGAHGQHVSCADDPDESDLSNEACKRAIRAWNRRGGVYRDEITTNDVGNEWL